MPVTQWFIIKSLTVPSSWIAIVAAFILTGLVVWKRYGKQSADMYSDLVFLWILVWKLSVIVTDFDLVVDSPMSILYFNGGNIGFYLALLITGIRAFFVLKKNGFSVKDTEVLLVSLILIQCVYQLMMVFLNDGMNWQGLLTVFIFSVMAFAVLYFSSKGRLWRMQLAIIMLLLMLLAGSFQPEGLLQTPVIATVICIAAIFPLLLIQLNEKPTEERI